MKIWWSVLVLFVIASLAFAESNPSLASVLTPDGEIMKGVSGSFDPSGFRMTCGSGGQPLFVEEGSFCGEFAPFPVEQNSEGT